MNGEYVITADEMKRLEQGAFAAGESDEAYMEEAGKNIAKAVESFLLTPVGTGQVTLLIGKGNNGGDAFVAGTHLLRKGFPVVAYCLFPKEECSELSQKMAKRFIKADGIFKEITKSPTFEKGLILDGIFGTGFQGAPKKLLAEVIEAANRSQVPIFSIDIPSGLNGNTGAVESVAISAHTTLYLGLPKIGFFLDRGWGCVGKLVPIDFGMPRKFLEDAQTTAYLIDPQKAKAAMPPIARDRHKYEAGYVLAVAGSPSMPGAAMLACFAALKAGAGITRLFHPPHMHEDLSAAPYELIKEEWDGKELSRVKEEAKRAKALIVGPGMGRTKEVAATVKQVLSHVQLPTVIDADALFFLAQDHEMPLPETTILTPHQGEMHRILGSEPTMESCDAFVRKRKVTLVLKGAPTFIFHPHTKPLIINRGDPGMATAGSGDVLTGILAALLAQGGSPREAAALGAYIHALAGEIAAESETSYGVVATDLIDALAEALTHILDL